MANVDPLVWTAGGSGKRLGLVGALLAESIWYESLYAERYPSDTVDDEVNTAMYSLPNRRFHSKIFGVGSLQAALRAALAEVSADRVEIELTESLPDGGKHFRPIQLEDTEHLCELSNRDICISLTDSDKAYFRVEFGESNGTLLLGGFGDKGQTVCRLADTFVRALELQPKADSNLGSYSRERYVLPDRYFQPKPLATGLLHAALKAASAGVNAILGSTP